MKILVVDDKEENRFLVETLLEGIRYDVVTAANGSEALTILHAEEIDLIISDCLMPVMDGFEFCLQCKADEKLKNIPFVFCTASYPEKKDVEFGLKLGAAEYIIKPFETHDFIKKIEIVIEKAKAGKISKIKPTLLDNELFRMYNERLVNKLEQKVSALYAENERCNQIEKELRISENNFHNSIDNSPFGIRIVSEDGETLYTNRAFLDIYGYRNIEEFTTTPVKDRYTPLSYHEFQERREKRRRHEPLPENYEVSIVRKNSSIRHLHVIRKGILWGGKQQYQTIYQDITERKQAEQKSQTIIQTALDGFWITNLKGQLIEFNNSFCQMMGYSREELLKMSIADIEAAMNSEEITQELKKIAAQGYDRFETLHRCKDNKIINVEISANYLDEGEGQIFVFSRDITEHKQEEAALKLSEQNFRNSMDSSTMGIRIVDAGWHTLYVNHVFLDMFGYQNINEVQRTSLQDHYTTEEKSRYLERMARKQCGESIPDNPEVDIIGKDGAVLSIMVYSIEVLWDGKKQRQLTYQDVTERQKAEDALKASEQNFRNSLDSSLIGIRIVDKGDRNLYLNQTFLNFFGYKNREEVEASPPQEHYTAESFAEYVRRGERLAQGEPLPDEYEIDIMRKDCTIRHLQLFRKEIFWNGKQEFQILYNDITGRVQAEEALKRSEQNFRNSLDTSSMGIRIMGDADYTVYANQALLDMFGYENIDEVRASPPQGHYTPESRAGFIRRHEQFARGEPLPERLEFDIIHKDGAVRHLQLSSKEMFWNGKRQFQLLYNDITERVQAQDELIVSELRYRRLFESFKDGILIVSPVTGLITNVNPYLIDLLGYSFEEFLGKELWEIGISKDIIANKEKFQELLEKQYIHYEDLPLKTADGREIWVEFVSNVYEVDHRQVIQCNIRNITERKQAEKEKQQLEEKAQINSRLTAVGEMAAGIAHEINNPLTGVIGFSQLLLEKQNVPDDIKDEVRIIADGSKRVADIVKRLLTFARQTKPIRTLTNLNELIDNTLKLREYVLKTANITVVTRFDPELPWSVIDPGQVQQVFLNLIVNAEQEMKKAHGKGTLTITTEKNENNIRISFQDDGPGITKENMGHLFEPFFTTKDVGEGTGLGLSLSRSIVLEHGGIMSVKSEFGQGATFIIELPIVESPPAEITTSNQIKAQPLLEKSGRILVVDDEPGVRALLEKVLILIGYKVDTITDAKIAMDKLDAGAKYDAILLDIRMPGMNGIELYAHILEKIPELKSKIIIVTGDVMGADIKDFLAKNNLPSLAKPFDIKLLKETINKIMGSGQS
jgi:PAS domain S-box-containing protein